MKSHTLTVTSAAAGCAGLGASPRITEIVTSSLNRCILHRMARPLSVGRRPPSLQGLTVVHFSAQLERFVWDWGCAYRGCVARVRGCLGCVGCFLVTDTAEVELRSGRV